MKREISKDSPYSDLEVKAIKLLEAIRDADRGEASDGGILNAHSDFEDEMNDTI